MIIFNPLALIMAAISGALAYGINLLLGGIPEGPFLFLQGIFWILIDISYRARNTDSSLISPSDGGSIFFLPLWTIGIVLIVAALNNSVTTPKPIHEVQVIVIGLVAVVAFGLAIFQVARHHRRTVRKIMLEKKYKESNPVTPSPAKEKQPRFCSGCGLPTDSNALSSGKCQWCGESF